MRNRGRAAGVVGWMAVVALGLMPATARAQYRTVMGGPALLEDARVQKVLGLEAEQRTNVEAIAQVTRERVETALRGERQLPPAQGHARVMQAAETINAEMLRSLARVLGPRQLERFTQIRYRYLGAEAFTEPAVQNQLELTPQQQAQVLAINQEAHAATRRLLAEEKGAEKAGRTSEEREEKAEETDVRRTAMAKVDALLTEDQRRAWTAACGEPVEARGELSPRRRVR